MANLNNFVKKTWNQKAFFEKQRIISKRIKSIPIDNEYKELIKTINKNK